MQNREINIVNRAVGELKKATGFETTLHFYNNHDERDATLYIKNEDYQIEFNVEIKLYLNRARLGMDVNQHKGKREIQLIITEYVNPDLMTTMETYGINFIDAAGNAYIKVPPLFIKIKGNKLNGVVKTTTLQKTFNAATLQIIYALLCNPRLERNTIREIADGAAAAAVTVHRTIKLLEKQGYLINRGTRGNILVNKEELLKEWVTLYPEALKPKYVVGKYELKQETIENLNIQDYDALWGGEEAAARLTNYLHPFIYTIYIGNKEGEFILRNRLRKDTKGKLILMRKFWNFQNNEYPEMVHPILIYADLLATGDPRNIETANIIYEKDIVRYIREN